MTFLDSPETYEGVRMRIIGLPAPAGSKVPGITKTGVPYLRNDNNTPKRYWRSAVREEAEAVRITFGRALIAPLIVNAEFRFPMPASRPVALRKKGRARKTTKPDIDKLQRSLFDALSDAGLIVGDAGITDVHVRKIEVGPGEWTGAEVVIRETSP